MAGRQCVFSPPILPSPLPHHASFATGYSPLDFTVLDPHWGTLSDWQNVIDSIHSRGMYIMADFTVGTMADMVGFQG